ncbi:lactate racemase domain-containing protein [Chloroflexota bacterium]
MTTVKLPQYMWHQPREIELNLPDSWQVTVNNIAGYDKPAMKPDEIRAAIASPIGMPPLREIAKGKNEVAILFDDMTRCTRTYEIVPFVLEELAQAGIADDRIRFVAAVANHHAMDRQSMVKKLGEDIVARFPVYNHCPFINCTYIGTSSYGTRASINSEVMHCDLKIAIGMVVPHPSYGFGGGAKLMVPGVASYDTVTAHHGETHEVWKGERKKKGLPLMGVAENPINADAREIAGLAGLDMLIDSITNKWGETVAVFAGALEPTYAAAVKEAQSHYLAANARDNDIVIANNFTKASEFNIAIGGSLHAVNPEGGDFVIIAHSPTGQVIHYLYGIFGKTISGSVDHRIEVAPHIKNFIIYTDYPEAKILMRFFNPDKVLLTDDWTKVIHRLEESHGASAKVVVYPNAAIQYLASE